MADTPETSPSTARIVPYLSCTNAGAAIEWYQEAFGAVIDGDPIVMPDGTIGHSELLVGGARFMVAEEYEPEDVRSPASLGGTTVQLHLTVPDVDAVFDRAVTAGAKVWRPVADSPFGERTGKIHDPYGHNWFIATPIGEAPPEPF
jgi:PhnB protein